MSNLVENVTNKNFIRAKSIFTEKMLVAFSILNEEKKKMIAATLTEEEDNKVTPLSEETENRVTLKVVSEARVRIIKARIRNGKVQRRKKVSNVAGFTLRSGKLTRMSPAERRRRKLGAKRGKIKRRAKMTRTLMKRQRSIRRRKSMGL
jgi:hypothetical protein